MMRAGAFAGDCFVPNRDPRVDAYIDHAAAFAKPILEHLRALVHKTCPDVEETMKWSMPTFMHHGMLCGMAAFKQHCAFGFWKHKLVVGVERDDTAMGQFGHITKVSDLPASKVLAGYIKKAMQLNESGVKIPRARSAPRPAPKPPDDFAAALKKNKKAAAVYAAFSASAQREYVEWISEAKREDTRAKRLATAIEWIAEGKQRNWKYMNC
jgi:uncharacterized protein YdeI (YjbR/CyaY-like superfamily)